MSTCATSCGRPTRDTLMLAEHCLWELEQALAEIPALVDDLGVTLTRQAKLVTKSGGKATKGKTQPLPFDARASEVVEQLRVTLTGWVRVIAEDDPGRYPDDTIASMARWLLKRLDLLAGHEAAADIHAEITQLALTPYGTAWRAVDRPADRVYAGTCGSTIDPDPDAMPGDGLARGFSAGWRCAEPLYAKPGAPTVRCWDCGAEHGVEARRERMLVELDGMLLTAAEIALMAAYLVADLGRTREQTRKLINQWHSRGLLMPHGFRQGDPQFRFDEVRIMLARDHAKRRPDPELRVS